MEWKLQLSSRVSTIPHCFTLAWILEWQLCGSASAGIGSEVCNYHVWKASVRGATEERSQKQAIWLIGFLPSSHNKIKSNWKSIIERFIEQRNFQASSPVPEIEDREVVSPGQGGKVL